MMFKSLAIILGLALSASAFADPVEAAAKRHKRVAKPAPVVRPAAPAFRQEPARMIEIAPGKWISSWGCYTDDGYGRYGTCDMREGPD
jgi:hypothetical protein